MQPKDNPEPIPSPQQALKAGRAGLLTSLVAAARAVENEGAHPAMVAGALQGVVAAQQAYNSAVVRIPLRVMTDGYLPQDNRAAEAVPDPSASHPATEISTVNPRKWADHFIAEHKNNTVDRESLVTWFNGAIQAGMDYGRFAATE